MKLNKYIGSQAQPFVNNTVISDFQNMLFNHSYTSICVRVLIASIALSLAFSRQHFHKNKKSIQIKSFTFEELRMFSMKRLSVRQKMFSFSKNIICVGEIAPFCSSRLAKKKNETFFQTNSIISTETWQTLFRINPQGVFHISIR